MRDPKNPSGLVAPESASRTYRFRVNGEEHIVDDVPGDWLLVDYLHQRCGMTGTKLGCGVGACGACKVAVRPHPGASLIPVLACYARISALDGMEVQTVEGLADGDTLHPLQQTFLDEHAFQCGFSTAGFLMAGHVLIDRLRTQPIREADLERTVLAAINGNLCRCTGYVRYFEGICSTVRGLVADGTLVWADQVPAPPPAPLRFVVRKQSRNDASPKFVFGWFASARFDIRFECADDPTSIAGSLELSFRDLRTGIEVRDVNVARFLLLPYTGARFTIERAVLLDDRGLLPPSAAGVPLLLAGTVTLLGSAARPASAPLESVCVVHEQGGGNLRVVSSSPMVLGLSAFGLPLETFAREFGIQLDGVVDVSLDAVVRITSS